MRPGLGDEALLSATKNLKGFGVVDQDRRLDGSQDTRIVEGPSLVPAFAQTGSAFHVYDPAVGLGAGAAKQRTIRQFDRLIPHRAENAWRQARGRGPTTAVVGRSQQQTPPGF